MIAERTRLGLPDPSTWRLHTQLDADFLVALTRDRCERYSDRLTFHPNDGLHLMGARRRYVGSRLDGPERSFHLRQASHSAHLKRALAAAEKAATLAATAEAVAAGGVDAAVTAKAMASSIRSMPSPTSPASTRPAHATTPARRTYRRGAGKATGQAG